MKNLLILAAVAASLSFASAAMAEILTNSAAAEGSSRNVSTSNLGVTTFSVNRSTHGMVDDSLLRVVRIETAVPTHGLDIPLPETAVEAEVEADIGMRLDKVFRPPLAGERQAYMRDRCGRRYVATVCAFDKAVLEDHAACVGRMWAVFEPLLDIDYTNHRSAAYAKAKAVARQMPGLLAGFREQVQGHPDAEALTADVDEAVSLLAGVDVKLGAWRQHVQAKGGWDVSAADEPLVQLLQADAEESRFVNPRDVCAKFADGGYDLDKCRD